MNESKVNGSHGAKDKMPPGPHPPKNSMPNRMPSGTAAKRTERTHNDGWRETQKLQGSIKS